MFEEILGLPAHPFIVHAAVIFVPLQILATFAYALVPYTRRFVAWLVVALAVVAPFSTFAAAESGEELQERLVRRGLTDESIIAKISQHEEYAEAAAFTSMLLGLFAIALVVIYFLQARKAATPAGPADDSAAGSADGDVARTSTSALPANKALLVVVLVLTVGVLGVGGAAGYSIFKAGDTGAQMVWSAE